MSVGRNVVIDRCWRLVLFLASRHFGFHIDDIAVELGVTRRTAYRYLRGAEYVGLVEHVKTDNPRGFPWRSRVKVALTIKKR